MHFRATEAADRSCERVFQRTARRSIDVPRASHAKTVERARRTIVRTIVAVLVVAGAVSARADEHTGFRLETLDARLAAIRGRAAVLEVTVPAIEQAERALRRARVSPDSPQAARAASIAEAAITLADRRLALASARRALADARARASSAERRAIAAAAALESLEGQDVPREPPAEATVPETPTEENADEPSETTGGALP
jgi:hypothetical protein